MVCFPIMHKNTEKKVIREAYKINTKYGILSELLFSLGYRISDVLNLKKRDVFNNFRVTFYIKEGKTGIRRLFQDSEIPDSIKKYIGDLGYTDYLFPSNKKDENGNTKHVSRRQATRVFYKIFSSIPKLQGAYGTHIFRKTFATNVYKKKGDIYSVQLALGHKFISSTVKYIPREVVNVYT